MIYWDTVIIVAIVGIISFVVFTFINVNEFNKNKITSMRLTLIFLHAFITLPYSATNYIYKNRESICKEICKKNNIDENGDDRKIIEDFFNSKLRIFRLIRKSGWFSYGKLFASFKEFYETTPFSVKDRRYDFEKDQLKNTKSGLQFTA